MGGAPAAPAPAPQEDVGEEGGGKADIKVRLPGSITRRAELFQRPRPRYVCGVVLIVVPWCGGCTYDQAVFKRPDALFHSDTKITLISTASHGN